MIFLPTFSANFIFPAAEFDMITFLTFITSDWIRNNVQHSHPVVKDTLIYFDKVYL